MINPANQSEAAMAGALCRSFGMEKSAVKVPPKFFPTLARGVVAPFQKFWGAAARGAGEVAEHRGLNWGRNLRAWGVRNVRSVQNFERARKLMPRWKRYPQWWMSQAGHMMPLLGAMHMAPWLGSVVWPVFNVGSNLGRGGVNYWQWKRHGKEDLSAGAGGAARQFYDALAGAGYKERMQLLNNPWMLHQSLVKSRPGLKEFLTEPDERFNALGTIVSELSPTGSGDFSKIVRHKLLSKMRDAKLLGKTPTLGEYDS